MNAGLECALAESQNTSWQNLYSRISEFTGSLASKTINAARKGAATALVLGAAILVPYFASQTDAMGEVLLNMEARTLMNYPTRIWMPNNQTLRLFIYVDNATESNKTAGIKVNNLSIPQGLVFSGYQKPNPYITNFQTDGQTNDFFYPHTLGSTNIAKLNNVKRFTNKSQEVAERRGWIAAYDFTVPVNMPLGVFQFKIADAQAFGPNGELQPVKTIPLTIKVVPDVTSYLDSGNIEWIIDQNKGDYQLHIPAFKRLPNNQKLAIKGSSDLSNWTPLATNTFYNATIYNPLELIDRNGSGCNKAFYKLEIID